MASSFARAALLCLSLGCAAFGTSAKGRQADTEVDLTLDNGLQVRLISAPETKLAAAAVSVEAGLQDDPADFPGLAHLLEHVLLSGARETDALRDYLKARRGHVNGRTGDLDTEYYFSLPERHLEGALERLARMLRHPGLDMETVRRELAAVDAEFAARSRGAMRRELAVHRHSAGRQHPWSRAFGGNRDSLGKGDDDLVAALKQFYDRHYTARAMTLTVIAPHTPADLERLVRRRFADLPAHRLSGRPEQDLFTPQRLPWLTEIHSSGSRVVTFWFPVKARRGCASRDVHSYLLSLLSGHGRGSLTHQLRSLGWIRRQDVSRVEVTRRRALVGVRFMLTPEGARHIPEVGEHLFAYLELVSRHGATSRRIGQWRSAAALEARYPAPQPVVEQARASSRRLRQDMASGCSPLGGEVIERALAEYSPDNLFVSLIHPVEGPATRVPHYGARYRTRDLPSNWLDRWRMPPLTPSLRLRAPSPFDPGDPLPMRQTTASPPVRIVEQGDLELWHAVDTRVDHPKVWLQLELAAPPAITSASDALYLEILADALAERIADPAEQGRVFAYRAGIQSMHAGLKVRISGFNGAFAAFTGAVLGAMSELSLDEATFRQHVAEVRRNRAAFLTGARPLSILEREMRQAITAPESSHARMTAAARDLSYAEFTEWLQRFRKYRYVRALVIGAISREEATALKDPLARLLPRRATTVGASERNGRLPDHDRVRELNVQHPDVAVAHYLRAPDGRIETRAEMLLIGPLLNDYFKRELRDQRQLGYLVAVKPANYENVPGALIAVQSPTASARTLLAATREQLHGFLEFLEALPAEHFERFKEASVRHLSRPPASLDELGARAWRDITSNAYEADPRERILEAVADLRKTHLLSLYQEILSSLPDTSLILVSRGEQRAENGCERRPSSPGISRRRCPAPDR